MLIISTREFRSRLAYFLSLTKEEDIYIRRPKGRFIRIAAASPDDVLRTKKKTVITKGGEHS